MGENAELLAEAVKNVEAPEGFEALVAGPATLENEFIRLAEEGLQQGETIGLAVPSSCWCSCSGRSSPA